MTISQLYAQGVRKVRLPEWNKFAYIELVEPSPGVLAPWGKLWDIGCPGRDIGGADRDILTVGGGDDDRFEEWTEARLWGLSVERIHAVYYGD